MDESFFQTLRQIQKKERNNSSLARVSPDFYKQIHSYINKLKRSVGNDPFADEHYLLKDSQRIATEICERREHKITDAAVMNIHRSFHLFSKNKPEFDILDTTPLNLTPEEETLYYSLIDTLKEHRLKISLDKFADSDELGSKREPIANPFDEEENVESVESEESVESTNKNNVDDLIFKKEESVDTSLDVEENVESVESEVELEPIKTKKPGHADAILDKLNQIKKAKVVTDEKYEDINKQIANQNNQNSSNNQNNLNNQNNQNSSNNQPKSVDSNKKEFNNDNKPTKESNSSNSFPDVNKLYDEDNQFVNVDELNKSFEDEYYNFNEPNPFEFDELIKQGKIRRNEKKSKSISKTKVENKVENKEEVQEETPIKKEIKGKDFENITIIMNGDVGPIVGVDEKVYGPFNSQDVVILPKINAQIFLDANKAKLVDI